ncbi:MAG: hypothetical protein WAL98_15930 [Desulfatiglandaceae bacterium]
MGTMITSNEVAFSSGFKETDLRIFFMCFLIVHLATRFCMDDYLGFTPIKLYALPCCSAEPQIGIHPLRSA